MNDFLVLSVIVHNQVWFPKGRELDRSFGGIRTHGLPLRRTKNRSPLRAFECPGVPYFTGFLTNVSVRISLQYTP